jgi:cytochrome c oxidase cbb3-type subunit 3
VVRDHDFDGIQEFDNQLPRWWVGTFVVTVLFGLWIWTTRHTFRSDPTVREHYEADLKELQALQAAKASTVTEEEVLTAYHDSHEVAEGRKVFLANCVACHRPDAGGLIGPNLTDDYWIHGGRPGQIAATITNGVPDKGMVTWKGVLSSTQIKEVAAYVLSVHGSHPKDPKAPQGNLEPWTVR